MSAASQNGAPRDYHAAIDALAQEHREADSTIREVWSYDDPAERVVRFVEVSDYELLPAENGDVFTMRLKPSQEFPFVTEFALLTPADWERLRRGDLRLPDDWGNAQPRQVGG